MERRLSFSLSLVLSFHIVCNPGLGRSHLLLCSWFSAPFFPWIKDHLYMDGKEASMRQEETGRERERREKEKEIVSEIERVAASEKKDEKGLNTKNP